MTYHVQHPTDLNAYAQGRDLPCPWLCPGMDLPVVLVGCAGGARVWGGNSVLGPAGQQDDLLDLDSWVSAESGRED